MEFGAQSPRDHTETLRTGCDKTPEPEPPPRVGTRSDPVRAGSDPVRAEPSRAELSPPEPSYREIFDEGVPHDAQFDAPFKEEPQCMQKTAGRSMEPQ